MPENPEWRQAMRINTYKILNKKTTLMSRKIDFQGSVKNGEFWV
jgi:hypothetical protein